jgi:ubiquinone/menaquinone biosynthesis C-methylase UbiE
MSSLSSRLFAAMYDRLIAETEKAGLGARRQELLGAAEGQVIEIGAGTGANLPYYGEAVSEVVACEPSEPMVKRLEAKLASCTRPVRILHAAGESIPVESGSFDVAVSTLVLCTVSDPGKTLAELHRVLKPGGRLLFVEHVRSDEPGVARWQNRLNFLNRFVADGCHCNRDTLSNIRAAGFKVADLVRGEIPKAPFWVRPLIVGTAVRT